MEEFAWPVDTIKAQSPVPVKDIPQVDQRRLLIQQFKAEDVVWIGDKTDSGGPEKACHFRARDEWLADIDAATGPLICPASFTAGAFSRSNENVAQRRFLVVESDTLTKDQVGAIFHWLRDAVELPLIAIVDTGGKSLHAWFEYPPAKHVDELKVILPALGCDPGMFRASQPARLPGVIRAETGRAQELIYLAKEVSK